MKLKHMVLALAAFGFTDLAMADTRTLIELNGATPSAGLASSWKKVKDGEYQFTLDPSKEVGKGTPVSAAAVKDSLETKLGSTNGVKVTDQGGNVVDITYTGDESAFLGAVAATKIRAGQSAELALESSTSEGGIRANPGNRYPVDGEVKATIISVANGVVTARVNVTKVASLKGGARVKIKTDGSKFHPTDTIFFMPEKQDGDAWVPKAGSVKDR